jgi:recombination protein RecA
VAALTPRAEINGEMGDSHMGLQARLMSQALRKLTAITNKTGCIVIFINQLREKIGIMFGSNETTTGGRALKFYASVRIDIRKGEQIKVGTEAIGARTKVKISKNKVAPPFKTCEFDIIFGEGIAKESDILQQGLLINAVAKSGSWFSYGEHRLGQGRENVRQTFKENPELQTEIENKIRAHYNLPLIKERQKLQEEKPQPEKKSKREKKEKTEVVLDEPDII